MLCKEKVIMLLNAKEINVRFVSLRLIVFLVELNISISQIYSNDRYNPTIR